MLRNDDRPGMIGVVGTLLGAAGVNILNMAIGQSPHGETAMMALSFEEPVRAGVVEALLAAPGILGAVVITET